MISKKLLSEVLDKEVLHITEHFDGEFDPCLLVGYREYEPIDECDGGSLLLNIYELAHKCKEWAYNLEYVLTSQFQYDYKSVTQIPKAIIFIDNPLFKGREVITASTEPEAIFKACEYILKLDNKETE